MGITDTSGAPPTIRGAAGGSRVNGLTGDPLVPGARRRGTRAQTGRASPQPQGAGAFERGRVANWPGWSTDPGRFIGRPRPGTATRCDTTPPGSAGLCSGATSILIRPSQLRIGEITSVADGLQQAVLHSARGHHSLSVMLAPGAISPLVRVLTPLGHRNRMPPPFVTQCG